MGYLLQHGKEWDSLRRLLVADDLQDHRCRHIYRACSELTDRGIMPDLMTVSAELERLGIAEPAGGISFVSSLTDDTAGLSQVEGYCAELRKLTIRRTILSVSADINRMAGDPTVDPLQLLDETERKLLQIAGDRLQDPYSEVVAMVHDMLDDLQRRAALKGEYSGVRSGFHDLDEVTDGFQNSDYIVIGARPSVGKTAIALTMAMYQAYHADIPVGFFSLEMTKRALCYRLAAGEMRIDHSKLRAATRLQTADFDRLFEFGARSQKANLYVSDVPNMPLSEIRSIARRMKSRHGIQILYVDYISLIQSNDTSLPRHEQMAGVSRGLKALARELDVPVVALSQLTRESEKRKPTVADLRESGSIEQDADLVLLLHREGDAESSEVQCIVGKHRNGGCTTIEMVFLRPYVRFELRDTAGG